MSEPELSFLIDDAGDFKAWKLQHPNARVLLDVMIFRWRVASARVLGRPGKWAAFDAEQWCAWSKLSYDQYKRALRVLVRDGLVIRERHRFGGLTVLAFIQPTPLALIYQGKEGDFARLGKAAALTIAPIAAPSAAPTGAPTDHTTITTVTTPPSSQQNCDPPPCIAPTPHGSGKTTGGEQEKGNVIPFPTATTDAKSLTVSLKEKPHVIWEAAYAESYPGSFTALTMINRKQLNDFVSKCPAGHGGNILQHAVQRWAQFCQRAKQDEAAFNLPPKPATGFLLKFITSAVSLWLEDHGLIIVGDQVQADTTPKAYVVSTPTTAAAKVQLTAKPAVSDKATKAEMLAILNEPDEEPVSHAG